MASSALLQRPSLLLNRRVPWLQCFPWQNQYPVIWSLSMAFSSAPAAKVPTRHLQIERRHRRDTAAERRTNGRNNQNVMDNGKRRLRQPERVVRASFVTLDRRSPQTAAAASSIGRNVISSERAGRERNHGIKPSIRSTKQGPTDKQPWAKTERSRVSRPGVRSVKEGPRDKQRWTNVEGSRYHRRQLAKQPQQPHPEASSSLELDPVSSAQRDGRIHQNRARMGPTSRLDAYGPAPRDETRRARKSIEPNRAATMPSKSGRINSVATNVASVKRSSLVPNSTKNFTTRKPIPQPNPWFPPDHLEAYVSCHPGLESILCQELQSLGLSHKKKGFGATLALPTLEDLLRCHLYLGTASHIFLHCGEAFGARALGELERKVEAMPWARILDQRSDMAVPRFHFKVTSAKSRLLHSTAIRDHVLLGIYKSLGYEDYQDQKNENNQTSRPLNDEATTIRLTVQLFRDKAQIAIDTSSTPLHQRAYRLETAKAPLREDIAYAFLYGAGWKPTYRSFGKEPSELRPNAKSIGFTSFLDPFCGSGTIPIEAASMAAGSPPGRLRPPPFKGTCLHNPDQWNQLVHKALQDSATNIDPLHIQIRASDRDKGAIKATKSNAERAGVLSLIEADHCAFTAHPWLDQPSPTIGKLLIGSNLPFGRRLSAGVVPKNYLKHPLLPLYQSLATHLKGLKNSECPYGAMLLTDDRELLRLGGFSEPFRTALSTKHGGIPVSGMFMESTATCVATDATSVRREHVASTDPGVATVVSSTSGPNPLPVVHSGLATNAYAAAYYQKNVPR
jgi:putative N6-adenine-specific DNA methylase